MRLPLSVVLACCAAVVAAEYTSQSADIPPGVEPLRTTPEGRLLSRLDRIEERVEQALSRLDSLTHTVDTQLTQVDNSVLQLYKEVGASRRLTEQLDQLHQLVEQALNVTSWEAPAAPADAVPVYVQTLTEEIRQSKRTLEERLNETQNQLSSLTVAPAALAASGTTTVIVERCTGLDRFQTEEEWRPADCAAIQQRYPRSGVYTIYPPVCGNHGGIRVFCDMDTDGGGWTVLMKRSNVSDHQNFDMGWDSYKWGFGNLTGEFWLGNEYMNLLTNMEQMQLRVDLADWDDNTRHATYTPFSIGTEAQKYIARVGRYEGNAGNSMSYHNNKKFTTKDRDNDSWGKNCATNRGGWWYYACLESTLTAPYSAAAVKTEWFGVIWKHWKGSRYSLKRAELKIRPVNFIPWCHKMAMGGAKD